MSKSKYFFISVRRFLTADCDVVPEVFSQQNARDGFRTNAWRAENKITCNVVFPCLYPQTSSMSFRDEDILEVGVSSDQVEKMEKNRSVWQTPDPAVQLFFNTIILSLRSLLFCFTIVIGCDQARASPLVLSLVRNIKQTMEKTCWTN